jgi:hypothetical protein
VGEQHISSSAAGILTATDPLFTAAPDSKLYRGLGGEPPDQADAGKAGERRKYP